MKFLPFVNEHHRHPDPLIVCIMYSLLFLSALLMLEPSALAGKEAVPRSLNPSVLTFIRQGFYASVESHSTTNQMIEFMEAQLPDDTIRRNPTLLAYKGAFYTLKAKHVFNPYSKIKYLRHGLRTLDEAVAEGSDAFEVRFLRFSVLHNIPAFLGYQEMLDEETHALFELLVVEKKYAELDREAVLNIIEFIFESKRLNQSQREKLQLLAKKLENNEQLSLD